MRRRAAILGWVMLAIGGLSCARSTPGTDDSAGGDTDTVQVARNRPAGLAAEVSRLEARLRETANPEGCDAAQQCKAAPIGERACGGPREYVVYCPLTTDEAALLALVDSLKRSEMAYNEATGAVSTCEYRMPPTMTVSGGRCVAGN